MFADPARLKTTLLAFVESLIWWARQGSVRVRAERRGEDLHLWAERDGAELSQSDADALFVPRRPGEGAGSKIGLFVARGVAEAQGGRTWAEVDRRVPRVPPAAAGRPPTPSETAPGPPGPPC